MKYEYKGFIPQNIAPKGATKLVVYDSSGNRKGTVPLGHLIRPTKEPLYRWGLLSDLHLSGKVNGVHSTEGKRLDNILTYFEEEDCAFCCHANDITNIGFWYNSTDTEIYLPQMAEFKEVRDKHPNMEVHGSAGNHENYNKPITENLAEFEEYTGHKLYYSFNRGNDVFIFIGQPTAYVPMSDEALSWLETTLEANKGKRFFIFVHSFISDSDSGNPYGVYANKIFDWWGAKTTTFINLLKNYNVTVFHGHSHMHFDMQEEVENAIYSDVLGFNSIHVPSISWNRKIVNYESVNVGGCYGYIVDVYDDYIILNGLDFLTNGVVPIGTYKVDTTI